jgi:hypothetical protein
LSAATERQPPALRIELRASRTLAIALTGAHALAAGAVLASVPGLHWGLLAAAVLAANTCWTLKRHALLLAPCALTSLELRAECDCRATQRDGRSAECRIRGSSYVSAWLIVLHLCEPGRRFDRRVALFPDGVGSERFRRLRVRLRWCNADSADIAGGDPPI